MHDLVVYRKKKRQLLEMMLAIFGMQWIFSSSIKDLLLGWKFQRPDKQHKKVLCLVPFYSF